jgi:hypothetical protein
MDLREIVWDSGMRSTVSTRIKVDTGNGRFRGPLAGRAELEPDTQYAVRVRHRDSAVWSRWSNWRVVIETAQQPAGSESSPGHAASTGTGSRRSRGWVATVK